MRKQDNSKLDSSKDNITSQWRYNSHKTIRNAGRIQPARVQHIPKARPADSRMSPPPRAKVQVAPKDTLFDRAKILLNNSKKSKK